MPFGGLPLSTPYECVQNSHSLSFAATQEIELLLKKNSCVGRFAIAFIL